MMPEPERPDPDTLLSRLGGGKAVPGRGRLKVFLGMCPGVGKTYAMLEEAIRLGSGVLVGVVETHGRADTAALLEGLPVLPRRMVRHRGMDLATLDLDAALQHPGSTVLVDELAHSNAPGSRHPKRYHDVLELIAAGVNVFTTVNIQHLESQIDLVRRITGVPVRETVPDSILDAADEIELVDLTPAALRARLHEGKIYHGDQAAVAGEHFFKEEHLTALRGMALRYTAERVGQDVRAAWRGPSRPPGPTQEKLLVAVGPSPHAAGLIRWTRRAAARLQCPWLAVSIETGAATDEATQERITQHLLLARRLGAETLTMGASSVFAGIAEAASGHAATQIIVGKPERLGWWHNLQSAWQLHRLAVAGGFADLHIVRVPEEPASTPRRSGKGPRMEPPRQPRGFGEAVIAVAAVTGLGLLLLDRIGYESVALLYLLAVLLLALRLTRGPMLVAAALSALTWDYLFIPPRFTLVVAQLHDLILLAVFFLVALVTGQITARLRRQERLVRERERRTALLQRLTETLALGADPAVSLRQGLAQISVALGAELALFRRKNPAELTAHPEPGSSFQPDAKERAVAAWVYQQGEAAGRHTDTLPEAAATWFPLRTAAMTSGVLGVKPHGARPFNLSERALLGALSSQLATALEKEHFLQAIRHAELAEQSNRLHKTLLDSVSHELKTPLAVLRTACERLSATAATEGAPLVAEISQAERRLHRVVDQLLDLTRLESGLLQPHFEWCDAADLCTTATAAAGLAADQVAWKLPAAGLLVRTDPGMMETLLSNLLRNAAAHHPPSSPVEASAVWQDGTMVVAIRDRGPGLPAGADQLVFDKFYRGPEAAAGGLGLGLSIVRGMARALQGTVTAGAAPGGGAVFTAAIPMESTTRRPDTAA